MSTSAFIPLKPNARETGSKSMSIHNLLESNSNNNNDYYRPAPSPVYHYRSNSSNYAVDGSQYKSHLRQTTSEPYEHHPPSMKRGFRKATPNHYASKQYTNMVRKPKPRCNAIQAYISYMTYTDITRRKMKQQQQYHPPKPFYAPPPPPIPNDKLIVEQPLTAFLYRDKR